MSRRDALLAALVAVIWGVNFVVIDLGMGDVPPLLFVAARFAAVVLIAIWFVPCPRVGWVKVAGVGAFMALGQFGLLYASMAAGMPAGLASLVLQAQVVLTILIAAGVLRERPTPAQLIGVVLGSGGLAIVGAGRGGHVPLAALALCLAAALSWAVGNVIARAAKAPGGLAMTVWSALVVPVPAFALSLLIDGPDAVARGIAAFGWEAALSTAYTVLAATLVGYGIYNGLLARNPASSVAPWILLVPVVGMLSAWLVLGETPNAAELGGGALLVAGVVVASVRAGRRGSERVQDHLPANADAALTSR
ncbi:EamA family transporter [Microbacterium sp. JZ31]|uniref:EamA family transporter n=1 Tax=Microbacterium sp. JZ31 TaxID=1906274 RepID=UPI0019313D0A|nr:EamA family transporter [Microbacterium sp. JZ31]